MPTDLELIKEIATLVGREIPCQEESRRVPAVPSEERARGVSYADTCSRPAWGAFYDKRRRIIGLSLCGANLRSIPQQVFELRHLVRLNLALNEIADFPVEALRLPNLVELQLYGNQITNIPLEVFRRGWTNNNVPESINAGQMCVGRNPIESPPREIIDRGLDAIESYFASIQSSSLILEEVKVLFVGDGAAGKTSLVKRLATGKFDEEEGQTDGININSWSAKSKGKEITAHIWDFGGQEIMHATHQFFLSERSLYVLVLDCRKDQDAEYWLKHITSFGGESPILVVLNKTDENPGYDVNRRFLKEKYPSILGFYRTSCKTKQGISTFKRAIVQSLSRVNIIGTTWPVGWFRVKENLASMDCAYVGVAEFEELCADNDVLDSESQQILAQFLHDLGTVVHFPDFKLDDTHVLQPEWLTGAVYRIINSDVLAKRKGVLRLTDLKRILKKRDGDLAYPIDRHRYIVDVMRKFELCYYLDEKTILIPDLLDVQEPETGPEAQNTLRFRIDYDFLPKSVLPRFIVKKHKDIDARLCWRTGCVLVDTLFGSKAVVKSDQDARRIYISVSGQQRRAYLTILRFTFLEINRSFESLAYKEMVMLPDNPQIAVSYDHLIRLENNGVEKYMPDGADRSYSVQELLGSVHIDPTFTKDQVMEMIKAVIAESEDKETAAKKANAIFRLQPSFMGFGIDLNAAIDKLWLSRK